MGEAQLTHGDARRGKITRLYRIWRNMIQRCTNPNKPDYKYYGVQGISVCEEWKTYVQFKEWAMENGYADNLTIDRKETDKNYCPSNCRWVTVKEQQNNKTNNHKLEFNGVTHTINEWAEILNIKREVIKDRLRLGWDIQTILTTPVEHQNKGITFNGQTHSWREWSEITGIKKKTLQSRFYERHWSVEKTLTTPTQGHQH